MSIRRISVKAIRPWCLVCLLAFGHAQSDDKQLVISATEWDPFTSTSLDGGGLLIEVATEAFRRAGIGVRTEFLPWKRAYDGAKRGTYDALAGASHTTEREQHFHFPRYHFGARLKLFSRRGAKAEYRTLADLCPATVGILRGSFLVDLLKVEPCLTLDLSDDVLTNVRKLVHGRIDLLAESEVSVYHYLRSDLPQHVDSITALEPPLARDAVYVALSKALPGHAEVGAAYDSAIDSMRSDGTLDAILLKYGISGEQ